jgi:hypothetical protein
MRLGLTVWFFQRGATSYPACQNTARLQFAIGVRPAERRREFIAAFLCKSARLRKVPQVQVAGLRGQAQMLPTLCRLSPTPGFTPGGFSAF